MSLKEFDIGSKLGNNALTQVKERIPSSSKSKDSQTSKLTP